MTPDQQPNPPAPGQYWPPQPQSYGPPPGYPAGPPVKPPNPKLVFWTSPTGIICMLLIMGAVVAIIAGVTNRLAGPASDNFEITVTSCSATTGPLSTATVGLSIKNVSSTARGATVQIEYRDSAGSRLDTDTARVQTIQPGDTVRHDESTLLDAEAADGVKCVITGIS